MVTYSTVKKAFPNQASRKSLVSPDSSEYMRALSGDVVGDF
jgi:hypothetical protein